MLEVRVVAAGDRAKESFADPARWAVCRVTKRDEPIGCLSPSSSSTPRVAACFRALARLDGATRYVDPSL